VWPNGMVNAALDGCTSVHKTLVAFLEHGIMT
jgi:hypothetical protein